MTKLLIAFIFYFSGVSTTNEIITKEVNLTDGTTTSVYICNSKTAKKYHYSKTCRGLNACSHDIKSVSLSDAKSKYKRTLCGWED